MSIQGQRHNTTTERFSNVSVDDHPPKEDKARHTPNRAEFIRLICNDLDHSLEFLLGEGGVSLSGFGGWGEVARPDRVAIADWDGVAPFRMEIPIMLDRLIPDIFDPDDNDPDDDLPVYGSDLYSARARNKPHHRHHHHHRDHRDHHKPPKPWRGSVQHKVDILTRLARPHDRDEPAVFRLYGKSLPRNGEKWVIEDIDWGDSIREKGSGDLLRLELKLKVMEHTRSDDIKIRKRKKRGNHHRHGPRHYVVKKGETLYSIAARFYGDRDKWKILARANNLRGPRSVKRGDKIKVPRRGK